MTEEKKDIRKVKDLIEELKKFDEDLDVCIAYPMEGYVPDKIQMSYIDIVEKARIGDELPPIYSVCIRAY